MLSFWVFEIEQDDVFEMLKLTNCVRLSGFLLFSLRTFIYSSFLSKETKNLSTNQ